MTETPSSSNPSQAPTLATVILPKNRRETAGFSSNFSDFVLHHSVADSGKW
ncbi:unnamed protein product, partial [Prunus armeniaca]